MINSVLLLMVMYIYGLAGFFYIFSWLFKKEIGSRLATWISIIGFVGNTTGIMIRWIESYQLGIGHAPFSNQYESLILFSWATVLIFFLVECKYKTRLMGAFSLPLAFLVMAYAILSPNISERIQPLLPTLTSNWLFAHVTTCFFAYAVFTVVFSINLMYILMLRRKDGASRFFDRIPNTNILDELAHQMLSFGFLLLLVGIITGVVWAKSAWGRYWGWDPKETWSLITCVSYLITLFVWYFVRRRGWEKFIGKLFGILFTVLMLGAVLYLFLLSPILLIIISAFYLIIFILMGKMGFDRRTISAVFSIIAFGALLYNYFGVNLLRGLHSF
jgi:cytochrome c-type biogenesis protein CcsB